MRIGGHLGHFSSDSIIRGELSTDDKNLGFLVESLREGRWGFFRLEPNGYEYLFLVNQGLGDVKLQVQGFFIVGTHKYCWGIDRPHKQKGARAAPAYRSSLLVTWSLQLAENGWKPGPFRQDGPQNYAWASNGANIWPKSSSPEREEWLVSPPPCRR